MINTDEEKAVERKRRSLKRKGKSLKNE